MPVDLNKYVIELALRGRWGRPFKYFDEVGSTNTEALEWSAQGVPHGAMVVTDHQTGGRGRRGRGWFSEPGTALQFSLVLRPVLPLDVFGLVSSGVGLAVAEAVDELTALPVRLKWPNDVTVERRKLAGILVESRVTGHQVDVAVAGIGINVSSSEWLPPALAGSATSIGSELARNGLDPRVDRSQLLATVLMKLESIYPMIETGLGAAQLVKRATKRSEVLGEEVSVRLSDGQTVSGRATRLLPSGALEIESEGRHLTFHVGEIEHLRPGGESSIDPGDAPEPE